MPTNKILYLVLVSLTCCREWISLACSARFLNCTLAWFILCRSFMGLSWMFRSKNDLCVNISCHLHIDQTLLRFCSKILFWTKYGMVSMEYILLSWDKLKDLRGKFFNRQLLSSPPPPPPKVAGEGGNLQREETCSYCIHRQWIINNTISLAQTSERILKKYEVTLIRKI